MHGYLSADIICSEKRTVFRESNSRKTVSFEEQVMSKDKYPGIFSPQMKAIVFIILQIFFATRAVLKIGEYPRIFPSFGWGISCLTGPPRLALAIRGPAYVIICNLHVLNKDCCCCCCGIFGHVTRLDQSRASENI